MRLSRAFGRPPTDPDRETLWLRLSDVPGLKVVRLNGQVVMERSDRASDFEIPLPDDLPARNRLELEVDGGAALPVSTWGRIAIVVRS